MPAGFGGFLHMGDCERPPGAGGHTIPASVPLGGRPEKSPAPQGAQGGAGHVDWSAVSGISHLTSYSDMFDQIVSIVSHDYAGCDGIAVLPDVEQRVSKLGSRSSHRHDAEFLRLVRYYLACTGDPTLQLIKLGSNSSHDWSVGFTVRAAADCLYVDEVWDDDRLCKGDRIVSIDGELIAAFRADERRYALFGVIPEREMWLHFIHYAKTIEVERASSGARLNIEPEHNALDARALAELEPVLYCDAKEDGCVYMRIDSLEDADAVAGVVFENEGLIRRADKLVLDLRHCKGGSFEGIEPLLPFLIDAPQSFADFMGELGLYCLYSKGNCDRMVESVEEQSRIEDWPEEEEQAEVERIEGLCDTGFVWEPALLPDEWLVPVEPDEGPARVVVLCDSDCCGEAETLLCALKRQQKATILGRPSRGASDYQQLFTVNFDDDILFVYPMAMTAAAHAGNGMRGVGVSPDVYVAWTPEELEDDVLLAKAIEL
jgi:hypothetical protein